MRPARHLSTADTTASVEAFMAALDHPFNREVAAIRETILSIDPAIAEGIKWNAPSFRTHEYFATVNLREKKGIGVILHLGAKVRDLPPDGVVVDDPAELLKWLGKDRAMVVFQHLQDFEAKRTAFAAVIRSWIAYV